MPFWTNTTIFLVVALLHAFFYSSYRLDIFDWNPELGYKTLDKTSNSTKFHHRKRIDYPLAWKINNFVHTFLGVSLGYIMIWILYEQRIKPVLAGDEINFVWSDFALFLLGYIGIKGRLPTVADSVQEWFKR